MASLTYSATDEYGNDITVRLPDWTGQPLLATTATPPDGTLVADGSEVSRASYPELFAKIGTTYGAGDGTNTFNLPDWRDEFPRFSGSARAVGTKQGDAIRNITGNTRFRVQTDGSIVGTIYAASKTTGAFVPHATDENGVEDTLQGVPNIHASQDLGIDVSRVVPTADENRPRNVAFLPCIIYV